MGFLVRRFFYGLAVLLGTGTYVSLRGVPWAIDAAICIAYTTLLVGYSIAGRNAQAVSGEWPLPIQRMLLIHAGFLAAIIVMVRTLLILSPSLPPAFSTVGHRGSPRFMVEVIAAVALAYWERHLLFRPRPSLTLPFELLPVQQVSQPASQPLPVELLSVQQVPEPAAAVATPVLQFAQPAPAAPSNLTFMSPPPVSSSSSYYDLSTGEDYEQFLLHLREGKRPFRKPGITVKQEYEAWLKHRAKSRPRSAAGGARA
jgi:hypothetical protein